MQITRRTITEVEYYSTTTWGLMSARMKCAVVETVYTSIVIQDQTSTKGAPYGDIHHGDIRAEQKVQACVDLHVWHFGWAEIPACTVLESSTVFECQVSEMNTTRVQKCHSNIVTTFNHSEATTNYCKIINSCESGILCWIKHEVAIRQFNTDRYPHPKGLHLPQGLGEGAAGIVRITW